MRAVARLARTIAVLAVAAGCHREPSPEQSRADCIALIHRRLRELDRHSFARTCGPLLPPACRPPTDGVPDPTTRPRLEAACRAAAPGAGSGDILEAALPTSIPAADRTVIAMALRGELTPPGLPVHVTADAVEIDGKRMSVDDAAAAVRAHGGGALVWGSKEAPATAHALMQALGEEQVVLCNPDGANCR